MYTLRAVVEKIGSEVRSKGCVVKACVVLRVAFRDRAKIIVPTGSVVEPVTKPPLAAVVGTLRLS